MSIDTRVYTKERLSIVEIGKRIVDIDELDIATKNSQPCATVYRPFVSNREVQISTKDYGYEININVLAAKEDYELYRIVIGHIMTMTGDIVIYENDTRILDVNAFFNDDFIAGRVESDFRTILQLLENGESGSINCPFRKFYLGERIHKEILRQGGDLVRQRNHLHTKIRNSQYYNMSNKDTPLYQIEGQTNENVSPITATIYSRNDFDFITYADRFILIVGDHESIDMPYDQFWGIAPFSWHRIDEHQFFAQKLDDDEWERFVKQARRIKDQQII